MITPLLTSEQHTDPDSTNGCGFHSLLILIAQQPPNAHPWTKPSWEFASSFSHPAILETCIFLFLSRKCQNVTSSQKEIVNFNTFCISNAYREHAALSSRPAILETRSFFFSSRKCQNVTPFNQSKRKTSNANGQTNLGHKHKAPDHNHEATQPMVDLPHTS